MIFTNCPTTSLSTSRTACRLWALGPGTHIEGAIIDKNCRIGRNVRIINDKGLEDTPETQFGMIRDGIIVIPKETTLPDNWSLE